MTAVLLLALSAPLPFPKPVPPLAPGEYLMRWRGCDYAAEFDAGGGYRCRRPGELRTLHAGFWRFEGGVLRVREAPADAVEAYGGWPPEGEWPCVWSAPLDKRGRGPLTVNGLEEGGEFVLTPKR